MKKIIIISIVSANLWVINAQAQPVDMFGGSDGSSQTVAHCGFLPTTERRYTTSAVAVRVIQQKLYGLGYYRAVPTGIYDKRSQLAVKRFQKEYGLKPDGVVGPETAQRLAYETHPSPNVRRCFRAADIRFP